MNELISFILSSHSEFVVGPEGGVWPHNKSRIEAREEITEREAIKPAYVMITPHPPLGGAPGPGRIPPLMKAIAPPPLHNKSLKQR
jgi:hypothetical protein